MTSTAIPYAVVGVASGQEATRATLRGMVALAKAYKKNPLIRELAKSLVVGCSDRDVLCEATALQHFVRDQVRYTLDVHGVETLQTPLNTLGIIEQPDGSYRSFRDPPQASGDCDDKATLLASLLLAVGIPGRFCATGTGRLGDFSHVLVEARLRMRYEVIHLPLETIVPGADPGWFPPGTTCVMLANFG